MPPGKTQLIKGKADQSVFLNITRILVLKKRSPDGDLDVHLLIKISE